MKQTLAYLLLACLLTAGAFSASKQDASATRIRFKRGESSAIVNGKLSSRRLKQSFLIGANAGQELYVKVKAQSSDGLDFANFIISDPSGKDVASDDGGSVKIRLKQTGDYRIEVTPPGSFYREKTKGYKEMPFSLFVKVQ